jgi:hypothetical protein
MVPALARLQSVRGEPPELRWQQILAERDGIISWGIQVGRALLGRPVLITPFRQGLGRTHPPKPGAAAEIEVADTPLTSGHEHGADVLRGLILHELGHHLFDYGALGFPAARGKARAEGLGEIFAILLDERLERRIRSMWPDWGTYIDRLNAYAFAHEAKRISLAQFAKLVGRQVGETEKAIQQGSLPGRLLTASRIGGTRYVELSPLEELLVPGLVPPIPLFLVFLVGGLSRDRCPDPRVAEALGRVPTNLKDLSHEELLDVARAVADLLGRGKALRAQMSRLRRRLARELRSSGLIQTLERLARLGFSPELRIMAQRSSASQMNLGDIRLLHVPVSSTSAQGPAPGHRGGLAASAGLNLGAGTRFPGLEKEVRLPFDPAAHGRLICGIRPHIRVLRSYLEQLGMSHLDEHGARRGRRIDLGRVLPSLLASRPDFLVFRHDQVSPDAYLGLLIDCSGSMRGDELERAKAFGALLVESARGIRGIEGHVAAFTDDTFYFLGDLQRNALASLVADGGTNDAGGLERLAQLALRSSKRRRLLIEISDGSPETCTFASLQELVARLTREFDIRCALVGVRNIEKVAFPHYLDLTACSTEEAVTRFGRLIMQLTADWRA